jgi:hypothetical protein
LRSNKKKINAAKSAYFNGSTPVPVDASQLVLHASFKVQTPGSVASGTFIKFPELPQSCFLTNNHVWPGADAAMNSVLLFELKNHRIELMGREDMGLFFSDQKLDFSLLMVSPSLEQELLEKGISPLAAQSVEFSCTDPIVLISFPATTMNGKMKFSQGNLVKIGDPTKSDLMHTGGSEGGSSGGIICIATSMIPIGIHCGRDGKRNYGTRLSSIIKYLSQQTQIVVTPPILSACEQCELKPFVGTSDLLVGCAIVGSVCLLLLIIYMAKTKVKKRRKVAAGLATGILVGGGMFAAYQYQKKD